MSCSLASRYAALHRFDVHLTDILSARLHEDASAERQGRDARHVLGDGEDAGSDELNAEAGPLAVEDQDEGACSHGQSIAFEGQDLG